MVSGIESLGTNGLFALIAGMMAFFLIVGIAVWVYMSLAFRAIAIKNKQSSPDLAWIPGVGPLIIAFRASNMHWWPWLLLIGYIVPIIGILALIVFVVYAMIWQWKLFEAIGKPGWWVLMSLIPVLGGIVYLILLGIAAWGKD